MTALHVFGPAGGMRTQIAARDIPAAVTQVTLRGLFDRSEVVDAGDEALLVADAAPFPSLSKAGDIVAIPRPRGPD